MPRPKRVIGHLTPWVEWCDELEAENKRLKSRGIEDMQHELAELREGIKEHSQCFNAHEGDPHDVALWALLQEKGE